MLSQTATSLLLLCVLLVLLIQIKTPFNFYDEGFAVFNATRIMNGDVPYKDFWAIYPPGQFYALAALFKAFGTSLLVSRVYDTFVRFMIAFSVWLIAKKITSRTLAYFAFITTALLLGSAGFYTYAVFPSLALSLLSILSLLEYTDTGRRYWLLLAGTLIGFASFFRWDIGLYVSISLVATVFLFHLFRVTRESRLSTRALFAASEIAILLGATVTVVLTCYGYVSSVSGFGNLWDQVVIFPTTILHDVRWRPYPALLFPIFALSSLNISTSRSTYSELLSWLRFYFPLAVYGIAFSCYAHSILSKRIIFNTQYFGRVAAGILGVLLFAQALSRYDYIHVVPTSLMASLVVVSLLSPNVFNSVNRAIKLVLLLLLTGLVTLYIFLPARYLSFSLRNFSPLGCYSQVERASCIPLRNDQEQAVEYIRTHTIEGESIFVGNRRHDLIFVNDIGFYFLSARQSASRYSELYPGVATTLPVQQVIAHDIESKNVKWIVLVNIPESGEPNASANSSGVSYLDDFIRSKYSLVAEFGDYQILEMVTR
ncbi:glycosyltransferase family 39 protein [Candidatus Roseilinea sp. NK_OTU-006]|uniref:glycosyltransferase family 39 protein n=1 Tax=Candidatus Roseilinea sp. NK_OTU-006 TaxID=2704250 RepID=UPI00145DDAF9|nr:glycosyltransferase family 39 protein [Candidatus Roseilinea sp. NK_OTU-006]